MSTFRQNTTSNAPARQKPGSSSMRLRSSKVTRRRASSATRTPLRSSAKNRARASGAVWRSDHSPYRAARARARAAGLTSNASIRTSHPSSAGVPRTSIARVYGSSPEEHPADRIRSARCPLRAPILAGSTTWRNASRSFRFRKK